MLLPRKPLVLFSTALAFLLLMLLSAAVSAPTSHAARPDQAPDLCTLLAPGALKVTPIFRGCDGRYGTGKFKGAAQTEEIQVTADVFQDISAAQAQSMIECNLSPDPARCTPNNVGDKGYELITGKGNASGSPATNWYGRSARGCYYSEIYVQAYTVRDDVVDQDLVNRGRTIQQQIDEKLKAAMPCTGAQPPAAGRLNVVLGGSYDEANDRVTVTAGVENRPNVGVGDDYYEWTLDGVTIQQGKELKSLEYDTSSLAAGEHEIVAKVTDIPNNVSGGATYKFTKTKAPGNAQPPKPANAAQVQITTPAGTQTANTGVKTAVVLPSGKAEIKARCDAVVYGLLTYLLYKEGDDPDSMMFKGRALSLAILVQAYCDKLLALRPVDSLSGLARPAAQGTAQDAAALMQIEVQEGIGQFQITHAKAAASFETGTARIDAYGKQTLIVAFDPDSQTTLVRALDGRATVTPNNNSLAPAVLTAGQQVRVTADSIGPVQAAPAAAEPAAQGAIVVNAVDNDPENKLWNCETNRIPFGNEEVDRSRCFTFRYEVPPGGIQSAVVNISLNTLGSLQDTDATAIAVGKPYQPCEWGYGQMPGCVVLHGGFEGKHRSLTLNLLDIACDKSVQGSPEAQQLVRDQLQTGVVHMILEDDTAVYSAQLVLNGGPPSVSCGASEEPAPVLPPNSSATGGSNAGGAEEPGDVGNGSGNAAGSSNVPGSMLNPPPYGSVEPYPALTGMTLQVAQRRVAPGELVMVPVWLVKGSGVANMNFDLTYDANVARPEGAIVKGNLLDSALLSTNPNTSGILHAGFAQDVNLNGTGTVAYVPFRAVGQAGDRTTLMPVVTTINSQDGRALSIDRVPGEIVIAGPGETLGGDCDGDGAVTTLDALCALEMSVQLRPARPVMDVDQNGSVTSRDAAVLLQQALEIRR